MIAASFNTFLSEHDASKATARAKNLITYDSDLEAPEEVARRPRGTTTRVDWARRCQVIPAAAAIGERQSTTEKSHRFEILKISGIRYGAFRGPPPRGFSANWAHKPQALSPVAATTC
jgi:hypothetical protein